MVLRIFFSFKVTNPCIYFTPSSFWTLNLLCPFSYSADIPAFYFIMIIVAIKRELPHLPNSRFTNIPGFSLINAYFYSYFKIVRRVSEVSFFIKWCNTMTCDPSLNNPKISHVTAWHWIKDLRNHTVCLPPCVKT